MKCNLLIWLKFELKSSKNEPKIISERLNAFCNKREVDIMYKPLFLLYHHTLFPSLKQSHRTPLQEKEKQTFHHCVRSNYPLQGTRTKSISLSGKTLTWFLFCPDIIVITPNSPSNKSDMENCLVFPPGRSQSRHQRHDARPGQNGSHYG